MPLKIRNSTQAVLLRGLGLALAVGGSGLAVRGLELPAGAQEAIAGTDPAQPTDGGTPVQNPFGATPATPLSLATSSQVWTTYKGDWQRTGYSTARVTPPLNLWWRHSTDAAPGTLTSPLIAGPAGLRRAYFEIGTNIYCVDAQNGSEFWHTDVKGTMKAPLTLLAGSEHGDMLVAATVGGLISGLSTEGIVLWTTDVGGSVQGVAPVLANTPGGQRILVALSSGKFAALTPSGVLDGTFVLNLHHPNAAPASTPALNAAGDRLFMIGRDQALYCLNLTTSEIEFRTSLRGISVASPTVLGGTVVVAVEHRLLGIDATDGQVGWQVNLDARALASASGRADTEGTGGEVYVGTSKGTLYAVSLFDGSVLWQKNLEASLTDSPLVLAGSVLVGTRNGQLIALNKADGSVAWRYRLHTERTIQVVVTPEDTNNTDSNGNPVARNGGQKAAPAKRVSETRSFPLSAQPVAVDGQLYVLADNASLYAFSTDLLDAEPPRALNPVLSVHNTAGSMTQLPLTPGKPVIVPGRSPISFSVDVDDLGSGVDPGTFGVTLNGEPLDPGKVFYLPATGKLTALLAQNKLGRPIVFPDDSYRVVVTVHDYMGNVLIFATSFTVDKTVPAPAAPASARKATDSAGR